MAAPIRPFYDRGSPKEPSTSLSPKAEAGQGAATTSHVPQTEERLWGEPSEPKPDNRPGSQCTRHLLTRRGNGVTVACPLYMESDAVVQHTQDGNHTFISSSNDRLFELKEGAESRQYVHTEAKTKESKERANKQTKNQENNKRDQTRASGGIPMKRTQSRAPPTSRALTSHSRRLR